MKSTKLVSIFAIFIFLTLFADADSTSQTTQNKLDTAVPKIDSVAMYKKILDSNHVATQDNQIFAKSRLKNIIKAIISDTTKKDSAKPKK